MYVTTYAKDGLKFSNTLALEMFRNWQLGLLVPPPQPFYGPFSGTTWVSRCEKRTSGLYGARED